MIKKATSRNLPLIAVFVIIGLSLTDGFKATAQTTFYKVLVDGEEVGWVEQEDLAHEVAEEMCRRETESCGMEMALVNDIQVEPAVLYSTPYLMCKDDMEGVLCEKARFVAVAYALMVGGKQAVVLPNHTAVEQTLEAIRGHFREMILAGENVTLDKLSIEEDIEIKQVSFDPRRVVSSEDAMRILLRGTDSVKTHRVSRGDSLWSIASASSLSVEELRAANPEINSDLLQIDQEISLIVPEPFLTVTTSETMTYSESIPYPTRTEKDDTLWPWQRVVKVPGEPGSKDITVRIARVNGTEIEREVVSTEVVSEPTTEVIVQGTKAVADRGTGLLAWPVDGGQVTSNFGYRGGRFHQGIDIAASTGTPIRAADNGTVVYVGWLGAYGLTIKIDHGGGKMLTLYGHTSTNLVSLGQSVQKGQIIARVGNTGRSTGPHLHFEVWFNGSVSNPLNYYR